MIGTIPAAPGAKTAHVPVMVESVLAALAPRDGGIYVDGTFGAGGYSRALLDTAKCDVVAIDRDPDVVDRAAGLVARYAGRLDLIKGRFGELDELLTRHGVGPVDGVALDLGVSSMQLDEAERGFSFRNDGPLDMRMEKAGETAANVVNGATEETLARIFRDYGEERRARRVAKAIIRSRAERPITRTLQLADIVRPAVGGQRHGEIDPATRTFQALRIFVNDELGELASGLRAAEAALKPHGRLAVVTFHSLEDRVVKSFLRVRSDAAPRPSRHLPDHGERRPASFHLLHRRAMPPTEREIAANPRARSARLRAAERTDAPPFPRETVE